LSNGRRRWGACPDRPDGQPFAAAAAGSAGTQPSFEQPSQQQSAQPPFPQAQATLLQAPPSPYELLLEGKRFTCTECGKCCQGSGEVWANDAECAAIARHLGLSPSHFLARYTKAYSRRPGWRMLKLQAPTGDCVFLEGGKRCTIYAVRPLQCSTYPWWPELMDPGEPQTDSQAAAGAGRGEHVTTCGGAELAGAQIHQPPFMGVGDPPAAQLLGWRRGAPSARALSTRRPRPWMLERRRACCRQPQNTSRSRRRRRKQAGGARGRKEGAEERSTAPCVLLPVYKQVLAADHSVQRAHLAGGLFMPRCTPLLQALASLSQQCEC
jgi:Fe-S-cluster containining protein